MRISQFIVLTAFGLQQAVCWAAPTTSEYSPVRLRNVVTWFRAEQTFNSDFRIALNMRNYGLKI